MLRITLSGTAELWKATGANAIAVHAPAWGQAEVHKLTIQLSSSSMRCEGLRIPFS